MPLSAEQANEWDTLHDEAKKLSIAIRILSARRELFWTGIQSTLSMGDLNRVTLKIESGILMGTKLKENIGE